MMSTLSLNRINDSFKKLLTTANQIRVTTKSHDFAKEQIPRLNLHEPSDLSLSLYIYGSLLISVYMECLLQMIK